MKAHVVLVMARRVSGLHGSSTSKVHGCDRAFASLQIWRQPAAAVGCETRRRAHLEQLAQLVVARDAQERQVDLLRLERLDVTRREPERREERSQLVVATIAAAAARRSAVTGAGAWRRAAVAAAAAVAAVAASPRSVAGAVMRRRSAPSAPLFVVLVRVTRGTGEGLRVVNRRPAAAAVPAAAVVILRRRRDCVGSCPVRRRRCRDGVCLVTTAETNVVARARSVFSRRRRRRSRAAFSSSAVLLLLLAAAERCGRRLLLGGINLREQRDPSFLGRALGVRLRLCLCLSRLAVVRLAVARGELARKMTGGEPASQDDGPSEPSRTMGGAWCKSSVWGPRPFACGPLSASSIKAGRGKAANDGRKSTQAPATIP